MKPVQFLFFAFVALFGLSCDSREFDPVHQDYRYIPLKTGLYHLYKVEEIRYTLSVPETISYQLKTIVADSFPNNEGTFTYVIHRTKLEPSVDGWQPLETWSAKIYRKEAVVSEGNIPYVVLNFPADKGTQWNGNAYNNQINPNTSEGTDLYQITEHIKMYTVESKNYDDCVKVIQEDNQEFLVYQDKRIEVYGRNVGLLSKEITQLKYCNDEDRNCIGQQIVDEGRIFKQSLVEYGQE